MKKIIFVSMMVAGGAHAADPFTSVYDQTVDGTHAFNAKLAGGSKDDGRWAFFQFADTDSIFGSLSAGSSGESQSIKFNAINYYLWFGGNKKLPFQLYLSDDVSDSDTQEANTAKLLDPESGVALKFPLLWTYQSSGDGFCAFLNGTNTVGHCSIGGDVTLSFKDLDVVDGGSETAFGQTLRVGAAVLFPILSANDQLEQGYLSASARAVYSHVDIENSTQLFVPVTDASGAPVGFDKSILSSEVEVKWAFNGKLAISGKWVKPIDNDDYMDDLFKITIETQL